MAEYQIILEKTAEFGWREDRLYAEVRGYEIQDRSGGTGRYVPQFDRTQEHTLKRVADGLAPVTVIGFQTDSSLVTKAVRKQETNFSTRAPTMQSVQYFQYYEHYGRAATPWFDVPLPQSLGEILEYNRIVLSLIIQSTLNVGWGMVTSTWWERLVTQYELSEETLRIVMGRVAEYVDNETLRLETASPTLFEFTPQDIGEFFNIGRRAGLALIRLTHNNPTITDYSYLEPLLGRTDIGTGLKYLGEHPKGSTYSGDFNALHWSSWQTIVLNFATGGLYSIGVTSFNLLNDIAKGDFSMSSVSRLKDVVDLGVTAVLRDISTVIVGNNVTQMIKGIVAAAAGLIGGGLLSGKMLLVERLKGVLDIGMQTAAVVGALVGGPGLPQPSTVLNPTGNPSGSNGVGVQNPYYTTPNVLQPVVIAEESSLADLLIPVAAIGSVMMIMKS